jgi:O-antigen/teichoic acid export membrane protein
MSRRVIKISFYLVATGIGTVINLIRNIVTANLLGPYVTGLCHTLLAIPQFGQYFNLGLNEALVVHESKKRGEKNLESAFIVKNTVFNLTLLTSLFAIFLGTIYIIFIPLKYPGIRSYAILATSLIIIWEVKKFFINQLVIDNKITRMAWVELTFIVSVFILQIGLIYFSNIDYPWFSGGHAFWYGLIISNVFVVFFLSKTYSKNIIFSYKIIDFSYAKKMIPLGIILFSSSFVYLPYIILARFFLASTLGIQEVGYFLLSIIFISKFSILPNSIAKITLPRFSYIRGEGKSFSNLYSLFIKSQIYILAVSAGLVLIAFFSIEFIVEKILPDYLLGVEACKMMMFAAIPYSLIEVSNKLLLAFEHKRSFISIYVLCFFVFVLCILNQYVTGNISAYNISINMLASFSLYALIINYKTIKMLKKK